jgi:hypothetical protein
MASLRLFVELVLLAAVWPWVQFSLLTELSARDAPSYADCLKIQGDQLSVAIRAYTGIALPFYCVTGCKVKDLCSVGLKKSDMNCTNATRRTQTLRFAYHMWMEFFQCSGAFYQSE